MDDASLQLLSEIRDSIRLLPNELVLRLERSRGTELLEEKGQTQGQGGQGPSAPTKQAPDSKAPWYSDKSEVGGKLAAVESFGFAVGRLIPEFGQLASQMQSVRNIFDSFEKLADKFSSAAKAKEDEKAMSGAADRLSPTTGQMEDRKWYGAGLSGSLAGATAPPSWAERFGGDDNRSGMAGLPGVAQQIGELKGVDQKEKTDTSGLEKLIAILENVKRPGTSGDVENVSLPGTPAQSGKSHEEISRIIEETVGQQGDSLPKEPAQLPESMQQNWPWLGKKGQKQIPQVPGVPAEKPFKPPYESEGGKDGLPGVPSDLFPNQVGALSGDGAVDISELAGLLKNLEGKEDSVLELLRQMLGALQRRGEEDNAENVEELRESKSAPMRADMRQKEGHEGASPTRFSGLKELAGKAGGSKGGGMDMKDMVEVLKLATAFL